MFYLFGVDEEGRPLRPLGGPPPPEDRHQENRFQHRRERPNIVQPPDDALVDMRLLHHLYEMDETLNETRPAFWDREDRIRAIMCRELLTVGYRSIKTKMNRGQMPLSDLRCGSAWTQLKVGPVTEFVTPVEDVERLWCSNQKAIEIVDRWPTFDDFYDVWNGVLGVNDATSSWHKVLVVREYDSDDYGVRDKYPCYPVTRFVTLDRIQLEKYWSRAKEKVEALKRIDSLKDSFREQIEVENEIVRRRRDGDWRQDRNVRMRLV